jgi:hypothetical protein
MGFVLDAVRHLGRQRLARALLKWLLQCSLATLSVQAAQASGCVDAFRISFSAKPQGVNYWLSHPQPFEVDKLPADLSTDFHGGLLSASIRRTSPDVLLVLFELQFDGTSHKSAFRVSMDEEHPRPLSSQEVDQVGNEWALQMLPMCPRFARV